MSVRDLINNALEVEDDHRVDDGGLYIEICLEIIKLQSSGKIMEECDFNAFIDYAFDEVYYKSNGIIVSRAEEFKDLTIRALIKIFKNSNYDLPPDCIDVLPELYQYLPKHSHKNLSLREKKYFDSKKIPLSNLIKSPNILLTNIDEAIENDSIIIDFNTEGLFKIHDELKNKCIAKIIKNYDKDIPIENLQIACLYFPHTEPIINALLNDKGMKLDDICINNLCKSSIEGIDYLVDRKIMFTKENFAVVVNSNNNEEKIIKMIQNCYSPDSNDIELSFNHGILLPDIESFDIIITKAIVGQYRNKKSQMSGLRYYKGTGIKDKYLSDCKFTDDAVYTYLEYLCEYCNVDSVQYFIKKQNIQCNDKLLNILFDSCNTYKLKSLIGHSFTISSESYLNLFNRRNYGKSVYKMMTQAFVRQKDEQIKEISNELSALKEKYNELLKKSESKGDIVESKLKIITDIPEYNKKVPKTKNRKCKMPKKYIEYFNIKNVEKISYIDIRKNFTDHIISNNMICENDNKYVKLPDNLIKLLKINNNNANYIHINNIDKIINLFYS